MRVLRSTQLESIPSSYTCYQPKLPDHCQNKPWPSLQNTTVLHQMRKHSKKWFICYRPKFPNHHQNNQWQLSPDMVATQVRFYEGAQKFRNSLHSNQVNSICSPGKLETKFPWTLTSLIATPSVPYRLPMQLGDGPKRKIGHTKKVGGSIYDYIHNQTLAPQPVVRIQINKDKEMVLTSWLLRTFVKTWKTSDWIMSIKIEIGSLFSKVWSLTVAWKAVPQQIFKLTSHIPT